MYRAYRQKRRSRRKKNIMVGLITIIIVTVVIKVVYGYLIGPSMAYTTLAYPSQNIQPKMDIKVIQTSLEDVLKQ